MALTRNLKLKKSENSEFRSSYLTDCQIDFQFSIFSNFFHFPISRISRICAGRWAVGQSVSRSVGQSAVGGGGGGVTG